MALREFSDRGMRMQNATPVTVAVSEAARRHTGLDSVPPRELAEMMTIVRGATGAETRNEFQPGDRAVYVEGESRFEVEVLENRSDGKTVGYNLRVVGVVERGTDTSTRVGSQFHCDWKKDDDTALPGGQRWQLLTA